MLILYLNRLNIVIGEISKVSLEHILNLIVECLIIQIVNLNRLEIFLRIEIPLRDQESLPKH